jgi:hypothetical protein
MRARRRSLIVWRFVLMMTRCFASGSSCSVSTRSDDAECRALGAGQYQREGEHNDESSLGQYSTSQVDHSISAEGRCCEPTSRDETGFAATLWQSVLGNELLTLPPARAKRPGLEGVLGSVYCLVRRTCFACASCPIRLFRSKSARSAMSVLLTLFPLARWNPWRQP